MTEIDSTMMGQVVVTIVDHDTALHGKPERRLRVVDRRVEDDLLFSLLLIIGNESELAPDCGAIDITRQSVKRIEDR